MIHKKKKKRKKARKKERKKERKKVRKKERKKEKRRKKETIFSGGCDSEPIMNEQKESCPLIGWKRLIDLQKFNQ